MLHRVPDLPDLDEQPDSVEVGLRFDGTDLDPDEGPAGPETTSAQHAGDDVDDLSRDAFAPEARFTDEQWDALVEIRRNLEQGGI